jgi:hypothetical protein
MTDAGFQPNLGTAYLKYQNQYCNFVHTIRDPCVDGLRKVYT